MSDVENNRDEAAQKKREESEDRNVLFDPLLDGAHGHTEDSSSSIEHPPPMWLRPGGFLSSVWNLTSISLGVGVFVQPSIFNNVGMCTGIFLVLFFACVTAYAQCLLISAREMASPFASERPKSFGELAASSMGWIGHLISSIFICITCTIANASHMSVVSKMLHDILAWYFTGSYDSDYSVGKQNLTIAVLLGFVAPFCLNSKSLSALRYISTASFVTCVVLCVSVCIVAIRDLVRDGLPDASNRTATIFAEQDSAADAATAIMNGSSAICFAFSSASVIVSVIAERTLGAEEAQKKEEVGHEEYVVKDPHRRRCCSPRRVDPYRAPVYVSTALCVLAYTTVPILTNLAWGDRVGTGSGNVLYLIPASNYWITAWCFILVVVIVLLVPVINFPVLQEAKTAIGLLVLWSRGRVGRGVEMSSIKDRKHELDQIAREEGSTLTGMLLRHQTAIVCFVVFGVILALNGLVKNLALLFGLCGSVGLSMIAMVLPAAIYLFSNNARERGGAVNTIGASFVVVVGLFMLVGSTTTILMST